jgi:HEAT repeat protein
LLAAILILGSLVLPQSIQAQVSRGANPSSTPLDVPTFGEVEDLQVNLSLFPDPSEREIGIRRIVAGLQGIDQLHRAFVLREWRDIDISETVAKVDQINRAQVGQRLETAIRQSLGQRDALAQLAVLNMIGEMGSSARSVGARTSYTRLFTQDVCRLTASDNREIRAAAAKTLGLMNPDPDHAVPALDRMLSSSERPDKLAASEALSVLLKTMGELTQQGRGPGSVEANRSDLVKVGCAVVPLAGRALGDADPTIRKRNAETLRLAAETLQKLVVVQRSPDAVGDLGVAQRQLEEARFAVLGLVMALKDQASTLTHALADSDADVRLLARRTLEDIANPQIQLLQQTGEQARKTDEEQVRLPVRLTSLAAQKTIQDSLKDMALALAEGMTDADPRARRAALDVLETLGAAAAPAAPALVGALGDQDRFVRWAAARTLGKISPAEADTAVPELARLMDDADADLTQAAAAALEHYGRAAKGALPDLIRVMGAGDVHRRVAVIHVLPAIDGPDVYLSIPALASLLRDRQPLVRRAAAETLGKFGPAARADAGDALARALKDKNPDVRKAADEALLNIVGSPQR